VFSIVTRWEARLGVGGTGALLSYVSAGSLIAIGDVLGSGPGLGVIIKALASRFHRHPEPLIRLQ
jgi:hypothetical protein